MADLEIKRGDDKTIRFLYQNSSGGAINITGYTIFFTVKSEIDDDATDGLAVISKTVTSHTNPTAGITNIVLTDTDTNVTPGIYVGDIQVKDTSGNIVSSDRFTVSVVGDVTRRIL